MQISLKRRSDLHIARKIWHAAWVSFMALIYGWLGIRWSWILMIGIAIIFIPLDIIRIRIPALNEGVIRILGPVMRDQEAKALSGFTYLAIGALVLLLFPPPIVMLSLLFLAFGDPLASYFGVRFGKDKIWGGRKTLQGTMAAFVVCTAVSVTYYEFNNLMVDRIFIVGPLSGLIGAVAEALPVAELDDNLTFPLISAILLYLLFFLFGGFGV